MALGALPQRAAVSARPNCAGPKPLQSRQPRPALAVRRSRCSVVPRASEFDLSHYSEATIAECVLMSTGDPDRLQPPARVSYRP